MRCYQLAPWLSTSRDIEVLATLVVTAVDTVVKLGMVVMGAMGLMDIMVNGVIATSINK